MALATSGIHVLRRQQRLFPCQCTVMRLVGRGGRALAAMTDDASKLGQVMRHDRVFAKWLLADVGQRRFVHGNMARGAAIDYSQLRYPDLLHSQLSAALQRMGIGAGAD